MAAVPAEHFFVDIAGGQRLMVHHRPVGNVRGAVLHVHPFAEEMNKCRRMAWLHSRALAEAGFAVLQLDLAGCGDSSGDFAQADWQHWRDDVVHAAGWLLDRYSAPLLLWGVRAGCLVACAAGPHLPVPAGAIFWQPPATGAVLLHQFLRLATAGDMIRGDAKGAGQRMRDRLSQGEPIEVAGYTINAALAQGLQAAALEPWPGARHAEWFEVSSRTDAALSPALATAAQRWAAAGVVLQPSVVEGPAFWQSTEVELAPALLTASVAAAQRLAARH